MPLFATVKVGSAIVKIYTVENRGRDYLSLSYVWAGERKQRMLRHASKADERKARKTARDIATAMNEDRGAQLNFFTEDQRIYQAAQDALTGIPVSVDAACRTFAANWKRRNGR